MRLSPFTWGNPDRQTMRAQAKVTFAQSPLLASPTPLWRSRLLLVLLGLGFVGLGARAAWVQVIHQDFYQKQGEVRFARTLEAAADRGRLLDRNGVVLADNVPATSVWAIPEDVNASLLAQPDMQASKQAELARLLGVTTLELQKKLAQEDKNFVWLKRQLGADIAPQITALGLAGVYTRTETKRQYPQGAAATQLTGFVNADGKGIEGLELTFNPTLSGQAGSRRVLKDRMGRVVEDVGEQIAPVNGKDLTISIDSKVQFFAYQQLKETVESHRAKGGAAVVLDVQTGAVLALVNFDANPKSGMPVRNRALVDSFEPGSVMKPLTIALALERGLVTPRSTYQTAPGHIMIGSAKITDSHAYGMLSVDQIIQKSSNVGTVKIALQMPAEAMWDFYNQVGLGQKPVLPFPGIVSGRLRNPKNWQRVEQATMSYGYGLSVSLFQMAQAYSVLANDGVLTPPHLLPTVAASNQRVMSVANARAVRHMLKLAAGEGGTAPLAQVEGYTGGGKTGTSHKQEGKGYAAKKYRSTFVGMSPIDAPRIVVAISVDEPSNGKHYGGEVAAPAFSKIVGTTLRLMGVAPDRAVKPQIAVKAVEEST